MKNDIPIACDMTALSADERSTFRGLRKELLRTLAGMRELDDGYSFAWPAASIPALLAWAEMERRCCPFLRFELAFDGAGAGLALRGPDGTKAFLQAELDLS